MVDYDLLEKMVDDALSKETKESLTEWLFRRRLEELTEFIGNGFDSKEKLPIISDNFSNLSYKEKYKLNNIFPTDDFSNAA